MKPDILGFAWYKEDQYEQFKKLCEDGANLPETYAAFLKKAENSVQRLRSQGATVVKVELDIIEFPAWCRANGYNLDSNGRVAFVNHKVASELKDKD